VLTVCGLNSCGGFFAFELVIPGRITIYPWWGGDVSLQMKNPTVGNKSRISYYEGSLQPKNIFLKFESENTFKMRNKPYPAL
jgi:hypothetical protein